MRPSAAPFGRKGSGCVVAWAKKCLKPLPLHLFCVSCGVWLGGYRCVDKKEVVSEKDIFPRPHPYRESFLSASFSFASICCLCERCVCVCVCVCFFFFSSLTWRVSYFNQSFWFRVVFWLGGLATGALMIVVVSPVIIVSRDVSSTLFDCRQRPSCQLQLRAITRRNFPPSATLQDFWGKSTKVGKFRGKHTHAKKAKGSGHHPSVCWIGSRNQCANALFVRKTKGVSLIWTIWGASETNQDLAILGFVCLLPFSGSSATSL